MRHLSFRAISQLLRARRCNRFVLLLQASSSAFPWYWNQEQYSTVSLCYNLAMSSFQDIIKLIDGTLIIYKVLLAFLRIWQEGVYEYPWPEKRNGVVNRLFITHNLQHPFGMYILTEPKRLWMGLMIALIKNWKWNTDSRRSVATISIFGTLGIWKIVLCIDRSNFNTERVLRKEEIFVRISFICPWELIYFSVSAFPIQATS